MKASHLIVTLCAICTMHTFAQSPMLGERLKLDGSEQSCVNDSLVKYLCKYDLEIKKLSNCSPYIVSVYPEYYYTCIFNMHTRFFDPFENRYKNPENAYYLLKLENRTSLLVGYLSMAAEGTPAYKNENLYQNYNPLNNSNSKKYTIYTTKNIGHAAVWMQNELLKGNVVSFLVQVISKKKCQITCKSFYDK